MPFIIFMKDSKKTETKEVVINLDTFAIPLAIVIAGVIIALGIFFANRNKTTSDATNTNTDTTATGTDTFAAATTNIGTGAVLGNKDTAKVAVVMYSDYQCPYCQKFEQDTFPDIKSNYVDSGDVIFVFRNYPLDFHGDITYQSAYAGECVLDQLGAEKLAEFHAQAYLAESMDAVNTVAKSLGVNESEYNTCLSSQEFKSRVDADAAAGEDAGVTGTPGFVIGTLDSNGNVTGKLVAGAYPYDSFKTIIDEMLAK